MDRVDKRLTVLAIHIEPAPYIIDLIKAMREQFPELYLRALFISQNASQPWGEMPKMEGVVLLPSSRIAALSKIFAEIRKGGFDWLHLAGWGHPLVLWSLLIGSVSHRKISIMSDSQRPFAQAWWKKLVKSLLYPSIFTFVDLFLPGGSRQKAYLKSYGVPETKIRIAQISVDVTRIMRLADDIQKTKSSIRNSLGYELEHIVFIFVGRLEPYKGIQVLLTAFSQLVDLNVRLLIVGDGSCRSLVESAVAGDHRINYVGRRDFNGVVEAFAIADVAVVPSYFEPWGLVVNEAMAAGLPIIATDRVGAVDDLVHDGMTGIVVPAKDVVRLQSAMKRLARDYDLRTRMSKSALEIIHNWRLEHEVKRIMAAWQEGEKFYEKK